MDLKELANERKWFDLTEKIKTELQPNVDSAKVGQIVEIFAKYMSSIHPISMTTTIVKLFTYLQPTDIIELINKAISIISTDSINEANYAQELICLKLYRCQGLINLKNFQDLESQIIFLKNLQISNENYHLLLSVSSSYYEAVGNIENAQENLFKHVKEFGTVEQIEKLVVLSILSNSFFDFSAISSFKEFETIKNVDLKNLFFRFQEGDLSGIDPKKACELLNVNSMEFLKEKIYLIQILKICFQSEQKFVFFEQFMTTLKMDEMSVICLLIKALGLNIINGWIDSEKRLFYFNSVLPRALSPQELQKMKFKFIEWKTKVERVLEAME